MPEEWGEAIRVRGARVHNLRNVDVDLPHNRFVVLTGLSGSGKSSLAFDTIHAEAQRRFLETLSSYARSMVEQLEPPDVDQLEGLPPTVAVDQKAGSSNPRSTVATLTELHDYLRLLYARTGVPHCPSCGREIVRQTPEQMVDTVTRLAAGTKVLLLAPLVKARKGSHADAFAAIRRAGLIRARIDGKVADVLDAPPVLTKTQAHTIEAVIDRLVIREGIRPRLSESIDRALKLGHGTVIIASPESEGSAADRVLSAFLACPDCGVGLEPLEPGAFSFNSPLGACSECHGLGVVDSFEPRTLITDAKKSLVQGAVGALQTFPKRVRNELLTGAAVQSLLKGRRVSVEKPLGEWPLRVRSLLINGQNEKGEARLPGLAELLETAYRKLTPSQRAALVPFRLAQTCPACAGTRLKAEARAVTVGGVSLPELMGKTSSEIASFLALLKFEGVHEAVGPPLVREMRARLGYLQSIGLAYLTLDRPADSLSGGELQRVRLASQLGSGLVGICYILDEPTAGLHPCDTERLIAILLSLRDAGNTVIVVEHDESVIRAADWLIDLGPGAGPDGGSLVTYGSLEQITRSDSPTARWLRGELATPSDRSDRVLRGNEWIQVRGASEHNLKSIDVRIPLGALTCVTGVSGSGKSTLVQDVLARAAHRTLFNTGPEAGKHREITGLSAIDKLVSVDQAPIGRTPRSTPATYTGVFDEIRRVYAGTREAKTRGFKSSRFSFNAKGGRCEECLGQGFRGLELEYLPEVFVRCEACDGKRFNQPTLDVRFKGKSIADVLDMRVDEALGFFEAIPRVHRGLDSLREAGLGYVTLGQSSTTLSGGESQRVKLAAEMGRVSTGRTLYILDEPTTGLHAFDVMQLRVMLERLADLENTIVVIEHNLDLIAAADWLIDLGPCGGEAGGEVVAMGSVAEVTRIRESQTGRALRERQARAVL